MTRVKICGVTRVEDAHWAGACGADFVGLNFYPKTPRYVTPDQAAGIRAALPDSVEPVGVFVNMPAARIRQIAARVGIRHIQLHGEEPPAVVAELGEWQVIRAFRIAGPESISEVCAYRHEVDALGARLAAVLLDAFDRTVRGGSGKTFNWALIQGRADLGPVWLAGGLNPTNVATAVQQVRPAVVDTASGVESVPGIKDRAKVKRFIEQTRVGEMTNDE